VIGAVRSLGWKPIVGWAELGAVGRAGVSAGDSGGAAAGARLPVSARCAPERAAGHQGLYVTIDLTASQSSMRERPEAAAGGCVARCGLD
jgi:hypothetical protein